MLRNNNGTQCGGLEIEKGIKNYNTCMRSCPNQIVCYMLLYAISCPEPAMLIMKLCKDFHERVTKIEMEGYFRQCAEGARCSPTKDAVSDVDEGWCKCGVKNLWNLKVKTHLHTCFTHAVWHLKSAAHRRLGSAGRLRVLTRGTKGL